ncbi:tyrosine-protein phosphatase 10D isoform X2 [Myzus persicae]|uniref:tyrosine-protein phosphatase 10D isoform X2 n=1 Tax=Myzus persicae TaxID=13164 RepID=UPI000B938DFB|nr:tyrosine-protein phosphatase 10D isoform X2 [Myzus persicae]
MWIVLLLFFAVKTARAADLAIQLPASNSVSFASSLQQAYYRLDYQPPHGNPPANTTIAAQDIGDVIHFSQALPGTRYDFWLYYSNSSTGSNSISNNSPQQTPGNLIVPVGSGVETLINGAVSSSLSPQSQWLLTWTASITTAPDPPTNLTVTVKGGKTAHVQWSPPLLGNYNGFKLKVISLSPSSTSGIVQQQQEQFVKIVDASNSLSTASSQTDLSRETQQQYVLKDLTPGATYQLQLFTVYEHKESVAYISKNFTTKPSTPGKFIVWFRNETTLLVLWQPSYPASVFTHYKVSVEPQDSPESTVYVEREGEPPGPAQAAFKGLVPGRAYNISVHTVSEDETSAPTTAQYRTIPLKPLNVAVDPRQTSSYGLRVHWEPPKGLCEFDKYQISVNVKRPSQQSSLNQLASHRSISDQTQQTTTPITLTRPRDGDGSNSGGSTQWCDVYDTQLLQPGRTYQVLVKTVSGKVASWPASVNVTLKPLPVIDLKVISSGNTNGNNLNEDGGGGVLQLTWKADAMSWQDAYQVSYAEVLTGSLSSSSSASDSLIVSSVLSLGNNLNQSLNGSSRQQSTSSAVASAAITATTSTDSNVLVVQATRESIEDPTTPIECTLESLLPGRNYSISVKSLSSGVASNDTVVYHTMKPSAPIIEDLRPTLDYGLNVSWKTDVNSRQETFQVVLRRNDTDDIPTVRITNEWRMALRNLYPGAAYQLKVFAISHGLLSEPHDYFQAVYPRPPTDLQVENITSASNIGSNSVLLKWNGPTAEGLFTEYSIKYRTIDSNGGQQQWIRLPGVQSTEAEIADMVAGQRYTIQVNTQTYGSLESPYPLLVNYTIRPNPVSNMALLVDATNLTIQFPRPEGLIDYYSVEYILLKPPPQSDQNQTTTSISWTTAATTWSSSIVGTSSSGWKNFTDTGYPNGSSGTILVNLGLDELIAGAGYGLRVRTCSHSMYSDPVILETHTMPLILSEILAVNDQQLATDTLTLRYTPTPQTASRFIKYRFQLAEASHQTSTQSTAYQSSTITPSDQGSGIATTSSTGTVLIAEKWASDNEWKVTWHSLVPGRLYDITVWTVSAYGVLSQPLRRQDRLYPEPITDLNATQITRDSVHLVWTLPRGQYDAFEIEYLDTDATIITTASSIANSYSSSKSSSDGGGGLLVQNLTDKPWFLVQGLRPYRNYTFTVVVRAGGGGSLGSLSQQQILNSGIGGYAAALLLRRSVPVSGTFSSLEWVPGRCVNFQAVDVQPGHLTLEWTLPESEHNGILLRYVVSWTAILTSSSSDGTPASTNTVVQLQGGEEEENMLGLGNNLLNNGGLLNGQPPLGSEIEVGETTKTSYYEPWRNRATVKGLIPGRQYIFNISGETRVGRGPVASLEQRMPILAPPKPSAQVVPTEVSRTTNTIQVRFRKNYFGDQNGRVIAYTLIVAEDDSKNASGLEMPSWQDVQAYTIWPPYQVLDPYYPFSTNKTVEDFTIGQDTHCNTNSISGGKLLSSQYCNGPLKPGTIYRVKVRAFTANDKFTDTMFSFPIQTDQDNTSAPTSATAIVLSVVVGLPAAFILIAVCAALATGSGRSRWFLCGSGKSRIMKSSVGGGKRQAGTGQRRITGGKFLDNSSTRNLNGGGRGGGRGGDMINSSNVQQQQQLSCDLQISRPVRVDRFGEHYAQMSADSDFRFSEEFEDLKHAAAAAATNGGTTTTAADLPCNRPKNRFTNILPYDHSRFKLQPVDDEEGSDYINANYVPGHNSVREFIVTQGPLHSTRDDFWRMCWESNARSIIMLTRCVEKGREKCDHYWPYDTHPVYYGDNICVTLLNDTHYSDWVITEFMVCRNDQKRVIRHFHFTTWPDFGVPSPPQTLCRFVRAFRERHHAGVGNNIEQHQHQLQQHHRPIIVHCSAGVGRSGTFIALDRVLQSLNDPTQVNNYIDVYGIVYAMRKERVWMVQTEQQYICIHQCIVCILQQNSGNSDQQELLDQEQQDLELMNNTTAATMLAHHNRAFEGVVVPKW